MNGMTMSLARGASWLALGNGVTSALGLFSTVILARLLSSEDFGLVAIATAVALMAVALTEVPVAQALIRGDEPTDDHYHTAWTFALVRGGVLAALLSIAANPIAQIYGDARITNLIYVMSSSLVIGSLSNPKMINFERELVFSRLALLTISDRLTALIVSVTIAFVYKSYWALAFGILASQVVRLILSYSFVRYFPRFSLVKRKEMLSFSIWLMLCSWIRNLNMRSDPLIVGIFVTPALLGFYTMGSRIASMSMGQIAGTIAPVLFPAFSKMESDIYRLRRAYLRAEVMLCTVIFPAGVGVAALAGPLVYLTLGDKWSASTPVLQVMAISVALSAMEHTEPLTKAIGRTKALFLRDLRVFAIRLPLLLAGAFLGQASTFGVLLGTVSGKAAGDIINTILNMLLVKEHIGLSLRQQIQPLIRPSLAAVVMGFALMYIGAENIGDAEDIGSYIRLAVAVVFGFFLYLFTLLLIWAIQGRRDGPETAVAGMLFKGYRKALAHIQSRRKD